MSSHLLEVKNLETRFFTEDGIVHAVNGISYNLDKGETLAVVGESGCGKSVGVLSLVKLIPDPPGKVTGGEVIFNGRNLLDMNRHDLEDVRGREIGMVFQDPTMSLTPVLPVSLQLTETLIRHKGMSKSEARERSIELMEMVNIPKAADRIDDYPHQFSGGVRQRIMVAMAISCMPKIMIADEPTTALDVTIAAGLIDLVKKLRDEMGMAIIWITHDLAVVAGLAQRIIVMYAGSIVESGTVIEVYKNPFHPYTRGLLSSVPRLDHIREGRLTSIEGMPPDLIEMKPGCAFAPRCQYALEQCWNETPILDSIDLDRKVACWVASQTGGDYE